MSNDVMSKKIGTVELYDVEDLSRILEVQERTVRKLLKDCKLKGRKLGKKWYVTADSLKRYFEGEDTTNSDEQ